MERYCAKLASEVTHQGSVSQPDEAALPISAPQPPPPRPSLYTQGSGSQRRCQVCRCVCAAFVRLGFLTQTSRPGSATRARVQAFRLAGNVPKLGEQRRTSYSRRTLGTLRPTRMAVRMWLPFDRDQCGLSSGAFLFAGRELKSPPFRLSACARVSHMCSSSAISIASTTANFSIASMDTEAELFSTLEM